MQPLANPFQSKQHFLLLDGLRGFAALFVVIFHFMEIVIPDYSKNIFGHGYLAVDFFFCLSGFVIAYAYDDRLKSLSVGDFFLLRLIRLQPLVVFGSILGLVTFLIDPFSNLYRTYGFWGTLKLFAASVFLIPYPVMPERYHNLFNLNAPAWSLFWEYVANIFYALLFVRWSKSIVSIVCLAGGLMLVYTAYEHKNLSGGWGGPNFWDGGVRILYSFFAGIMVFRMKLAIKNSLGFIGLTVVLALALFSPFGEAYNWWLESFIVLFYFPLIVALGAGSNSVSAYKTLAVWSGELSYPLYMVHYPFVWIFLTYVSTQKPSTDTLAWLIPIAVIAIVIFSYLVFRFVDRPLRSYLRSKLVNAG